MTTPELITAGKDIALACCAIIGASCAVIGLNAWKKQLAAEASMECGRELLRRANALDSEIASFGQGLSGLVTPVGAIEEFPDLMATKVTQGAAPVLRAINDFNVAALEAELIWGKSTKNECQKYRDAFVFAFDQGSAMVALANEHANSERYEELKANLSYNRDSELSKALRLAKSSLSDFARTKMPGTHKD